MDKKWKKLWITTNTVGSTQMSAFAKIDDAYFQTLDAVSLSGAVQWSNSGDVLWGQFTWGGGSISKHRLALNVSRGTNFQLKYESAQSAGTEQIYEHELFYKPKKIK